MPATTMPTLTTLRAVPDFAIGHVRDLRIRWALEEIGRPYQLRVIGPEEQNSAAYRQQQPFGQVPVYQDGEVVLFESAAILYHLGGQSARLMPEDADGKAHTLSWLFAAANSIQPALDPLTDLRSAGDAPWAVGRRADMEAQAHRKLAGLGAWLRDRTCLLERFTVADIAMAATLKVLDDAMLNAHPALAAYYARCIARPAYVKALADQVALYRGTGPH